MKKLLKQIKHCDICSQYLPHGVRPVVQASKTSKIMIIGQAPGRKVHESGVPWDDASGDQLRAWLGVDKNCFYDAGIFAFMPMGFCYPGTGKTGDLAPRKECAPQWHDPMLRQMHEIELTLLIGQYAQSRYLKPAQRNLTANVQSFAHYLPDYLPLPHPSPRNRLWQSKNPWFVEEVLPCLSELVAGILKN